MPTESKARISRSRNSKRCDRKDLFGQIHALLRSLAGRTGRFCRAGGVAGHDGSYCRRCGKGRRVGRRRQILDERLCRLNRLVDRLFGCLYFAADAAFETARRLLHVGLQLLQFVELQFAIDVRLHIVDITLQAPEQQAGRARHLGQTLGADHHQGNDGDDNQF